MTSRSKKGTATPVDSAAHGGRQTPHAASTPIMTPSSASQGRSQSPVSPTRVSRLQEKMELQNLNDRLACYIDRVRNLENENSRLVMEVQTSRETVSREVTNIKSMYEHELSDARKLLDETAREKAKLEIELSRLREERDDLAGKFDRKSKDYLIADSNARKFEKNYNEINGKYSAVCSERNKALSDLKELEKEIDRLRALLNEARKNLEEETLARVDLENNIQSLREELAFKDQVHNEEIKETRTRREVEISEIDGRLHEQYETKLEQALQELRDEYEGQMRYNRAELEQIYENKIRSLEDAAQRNLNASGARLEELRESRVLIDNLSGRVGELEGQNSSLIARIRDLQAVLDAERGRHAQDRLMLESEIQRLKDEINAHLKEYKDLMDIKLSLDVELATYDKLLKCEEHRLNINSPTNSPVQESYSLSQTRRAPSRAGGKRKRTILDETLETNQDEYSVVSSAKTDIEICDADSEGKYIKLYNKSDKEIAIGGWQLIRQAGGNETTFKLHRSVKIDAQGNVTIWSSDAGVTHDPPKNIVMKSQKWFIGDTAKTQLINATGEESASYERVKQTSSTRVTRHRESGGGFTSRLERQALRSAIGDEYYHSQGDPKGQEKCKVM